MSKKKKKNKIEKTHLKNIIVCVFVCIKTSPTLETPHTIASHVGNIVNQHIFLLKSKQLPTQVYATSMIESKSTQKWQPNHKERKLKQTKLRV